MVRSLPVARSKFGGREAAHASFLVFAFIARACARGVKAQSHWQCEQCPRSSSPSCRMLPRSSCHISMLPACRILVDLRSLVCVLGLKQRAIQYSQALIVLTILRGTTQSLAAPEPLRATMRTTSTVWPQIRSGARTMGTIHKKQHERAQKHARRVQRVRNAFIFTNRSQLQSRTHGSW